MKEIFNSVIRKKVKILIKTLGDGTPELVINLPLSMAEFDSIEWNQDNKRIYLNIFDEDLEYAQNFDDLPDEITGYVDVKKSTAMLCGTNANSSRKIRLYVPPRTPAADVA